MKDSFSPGGSLQLKHHNNFIESMRDNIKELNRSMSSIEKMIAQSRRIVLQSKENVISRTMSKERKGQSPAQLNSSHSPHKLISGRQSANSPTDLHASHQNHCRSAQIEARNNKVSRLTFATNSKISHFNTEKTSLKHQQNLAKFQPKTVKKEIQLRRSGANNPSVSSVTENEEVKFTPKRESKGLPPNSPPTEPYQRIVSQGNEIYRFSPMKTGSKEKQSHRVLSSHKQSVPKIKLKATPRNSNPRESKISELPLKIKKQSSQMGNIRIEDDQAEDTEDRQQSLFSQRQDSRFKYRYKTEYSQEQQQSLFLKHNQAESPLQRSYNKRNQDSNKKINIRLLFGNDSHRKQPSIPSYRDPKVISQEVTRSTPRENRSILVKELQQLETASASEQERKAKYILKIKKYGFVEKYLTESQIWAIYDHLVWTNVPELKWPIFIVDEVYKKMKNTK